MHHNPRNPSPLRFALCHPAARSALFRALLITLAAATALAGSAPPKITLTLSERACKTTYTGRVFVMFSTSPRGSPIDGPSWFGTQPFYAVDVTNWKPGAELEIDPQRALGYPMKLSDLPAGDYRVQAAIDLNGWSHEVVGAPGNAISEITTYKHATDAPGEIRLTLDQTVPPLKLTDTEDVRIVAMRSKLLSDFHKRDVTLHAAVGLPDSYGDEPDRRYPTLYVIPGFGGTIRHASMARMTRMLGSSAGLECVVVYLDPDCPTGHSVFADSANNGPFGAALTQELIPHLEKEYRLIAEPTARYLNGHSSGGWSSLWLQVAYPDFFGGTWSTSPDPVDFSAFQTIDIYDSSQNFYVMPDGTPRPISRGRGSRGGLTCRGFCDMEAVVGRGGQMYSFCAVFGPRGEDGKPVTLWDWQSGALNPKVAEYWKRYDIRLILERDWATLGPKLKGKLHLWCGDKDDFYLDGAFLKLRDTLKQLGSDAYVEVVPGAGHGLPPNVHATIARQIAEQFERTHSSPNRP